MTLDLTQLLTTDLGSWSTDPTRPDYASAAYREMLPRWQLVADLRSGTPAIREKCTYYLPRFEAETDKDYAARVLMTFVRDHYAGTLTEHAGLVFAAPPTLGDDVPEALKPLLEDVDGEGNHWEVFALSALDAALHYGHAVLFTDYPTATGVKTKRDAKRVRLRPYVTLYPAPDVLSPEYATVGGIQVLVRVTFREWVAGGHGTPLRERFRTVEQAVTTDEATGVVTGLGAITWKAEKKVGEGYELEDEGVIVGPEHICARVVYGGEKLGAMHSKPHLIGLAYSNIEETQVLSDQAAVMHKCNVPTPIFIGRQKAPPGTDETIKMGQGIDIPIGGDAKMLEPSGSALGATDRRLERIGAQMRRQGATMDDAAATMKTAAEARMYAKQRNAKLTRAARSLQDALEGMLADLAVFQGLPNGDGGSVVVNQDFAGTGLDPAYLAVLVSAYEKDALPLDALLTALKTGRLPEEFNAEEEALQLVAEAMAREDQRQAEAEEAAEAAESAQAAAGAVVPEAKP